MALDTAEEVVTAARTLLNDIVAPYRYSDDTLVVALNVAFQEAKMRRPDLFIGLTIPNYTSPPNSTAIGLDEMYRIALVFYICGYAQLIDEEDNQDARAASFLTTFNNKMTGAFTKQ